MNPPEYGAAGRGLWGEQLAEAVLLACGYTCVDRRFRTGGGEIDLVVRCGPVLAFVEVKTRGADGVAPPEFFIDAGKRRRVRRAAVAWLAAHPGQGAPQVRFDVVAVVHQGTGGGVDIRHLTDVF
jgi:putative endonuclease